MKLMIPGINEKNESETFKRDLRLSVGKSQRTIESLFLLLQNSKLLFWSLWGWEEGSLQFNTQLLSWHKQSCPDLNLFIAQSQVVPQRPCLEMLSQRKYSKMVLSESTDFLGTT